MNSEQILEQFQEEAPGSRYITKKIFEAFLQRAAKIYSGETNAYRAYWEKDFRRENAVEMRRMADNVFGKDQYYLYPKCQEQMPCNRKKKTDSCTDSV